MCCRYTAKVKIKLARKVDPTKSFSPSSLVQCTFSFLTRITLASTPESDYGKKRKAIRNKENIPDISDSGDEDDSDSFDRSAEISDIDARLNRLQQLMKTTMS
ncbi:hypothetical protein CHS0354_040138 [Potamilus streckersoni]|uniref:Uncharacterized protein n=1 Tax=Potamilus streckersoni TaxID=2493646 RepID=A0AAE0ST27_9BIVA|nr:hypothetical protein CHS0354_040138 [Potamilus streckersoni]